MIKSGCPDAARAAKPENAPAAAAPAISMPRRDIANSFIIAPPDGADCGPLNYRI
jgi:hypothetical protein